MKNYIESYVPTSITCILQSYFTLYERNIPYSLSNCSNKNMFKLKLNIPVCVMTTMHIHIDDNVNYSMGGQMYESCATAIL